MDARVTDKFGGGADAPETLLEKVIRMNNVSSRRSQDSVRSALGNLMKVHEIVQSRFRPGINHKREKTSCPYRIGCSLCACLNCDFTCCLLRPGTDNTSHFSQTGHVLGYSKLHITGIRTALFSFKTGQVIHELEPDKDEINSFLKNQLAEFPITLNSRVNRPGPPRTYCRGLVNFGKTCYINCIMQVLIHLPLVNRFFDDKKQDLTWQRMLSQPLQGIDKLSLITVFYDLLKEFQVRDPMPICKSASKLLALVWKKLPLVGFNRQHDAHEFFISVINLWHKELLQSKYSTNGSTKSLVDELFLGRLQSEVTCTVCGHSRYTDDPFWDAALEVVSDGPRGTPIHLEDLLTRYTREEQLDDFNLLDCSCCAKETKSTKQLKFKVLPHVFCLQLKRFQHNPRYSGSNSFTKIKTKVQIPERIDFSPFRCSPRRSETKKQRLDSSSISTATEEPREYWYRLYAIVNHTGTYASGHFRTYIRKSGYWIMFDDKVVKRVSLAEALQSEGYLLFYQKTFSLLTD